MSKQTKNKRYLFRGFYPDENGSTAITLNGEKIKGEWVYGFYCQFHNRPKLEKENSHQIFVLSEDAYLCGSCIGGVWYIVIPETVGQWVRLDKNGKDVFVGDRMAFKNPSYENMETGEVIYDEEDLSFELVSDRDKLWDLFGYEDEFYELIGNKWEEEQ